jgi:hypothetical protein
MILTPHAYAQCRSNKGAPGVDHQDFEAVEGYGAPLAERDGFEPEISLAVLPRTQSETPVLCPSQAWAAQKAVNAANLPTAAPSRATIVSRAGRTPGGAERSASVPVASEFLPIGPLQQIASALALVSLLEFVAVDPALGA